jgi:hypothetical protein
VCVETNLRPHTPSYTHLHTHTLKHLDFSPGTYSCLCDKTSIKYKCDTEWHGGKNCKNEVVGDDNCDATCGDNNCNEIGYTCVCAACPGGMYGANGWACTTCEAGYACSGGTDENRAKCGAGTYAAAGSASCSNCAHDNKYSASGAGSCGTCPAGYSTSGGGTTTRTTCSRCEGGYYCSGNSAKNECAKGKVRRGYILCVLCSVCAVCLCTCC